MRNTYLQRLQKFQQDCYYFGDFPINSFADSFRNFFVNFCYVSFKNFFNISFKIFFGNSVENCLGNSLKIPSISPPDFYFVISSEISLKTPLKLLRHFLRTDLANCFWFYLFRIFFDKSQKISFQIASVIFFNLPSVFCKLFC